MQPLIFRRAKLVFAVVSAFIVGCGGGAQDARFPTASEIARIGEGPAPARVSDPGQKDVDVWDLKDVPAQPPNDVPHPPSGPWERLLAEASARRQGLLWTPESMHCLAKQAGLFVLAEGGVPSDELTRFMAARCGVAEADISLPHVTASISASATDDQLFASGRGSVEQLLSKFLGNGGQVAGIWAGRDKGKLVVILPFGPRRARLDRVPVSPDASNHVVVSGELLTPADRVEALANYGKFGFRQCAVLPQVRLPRFAVDCETNPDDPSVTIEIGAFPPGRITGHFVANVLVWPPGRVPSQYTRPSFGLAMGTGPDFSSNLVAALNRVRKDAGLAQLVMNAEESATATRVAPHYFAALMGTVPETTADTIVLGLRAGWQIPGLVGHGHFTSSLTRKTADPSALLQSALNRPSGRETLLDPDVRVIAIGPLVSRDEGVLAGVFSTYSLLEPSATKKEVAAVLGALNQQRKNRGLGPAALMESLQAVAAGSARSVELGQRSPDDAVEDLLQKTSNALRAGVEGWFTAAEKFERLKFPDKLLTAPAPRVAIGVAHYKPKGSPWGAYGVLIVTASNGEMVATTPPAKLYSCHPGPTDVE